MTLELIGCLLQRLRAIEKSFGPEGLRGFPSTSPLPLFEGTRRPRVVGCHRVAIFVYLSAGILAFMIGLLRLVLGPAAVTS